MHKCIWVSCFAAIVVLSSCASSQRVGAKKTAGVWQVQPIVIDGQNIDWQKPYPNYDDKAMLGYAVTNDKNNLYITVETGDPATQLKILKNGLTVWLDKTGGTNELTAINYPLPEEVYLKTKPGSKSVDGDGLIQLSNENWKKRMFDIQDRVSRKIVTANEFSLQGFRACNYQFAFAEKDSCGIEVRMTLDEDKELVWEAVIPFRAFYFKPEISKADGGKAMSICLETTGSKRPAGQAAAPKGSRKAVGFRPGFSIGGGMGMGLSMGGGGTRTAPGTNTQPDNAMEPLYKSTKTWKKFGIAFKESGDLGGK